MCPAALGGNGAGIDREDDALRAETLTQFLQQFRARNRRGVDADLVGTGTQQTIDIRDRAHSTADGQRNENLLGSATYDVEHRAAIRRGGGHIQEGQFVGA